MDEHPFITLVCGCCGHTIQVPSYCGNRFCPTCGRIRSRRLLRRIGSVTAKIVPKKGDTIKLLTLTVPRSRNLKGTVDELIRSFRRFRQRAWWKKHVRGGAYFIEFKHTANGWNPHLHVLVESSFMPVKTIRQHWERVSTGKIVDIRRIPIGSAIRYCAKYCAKLDLPTALQQQASDSLQNRRLFTFFGYWSRVPADPVSDAFSCKKCGVRSWYFNPFTNLDQWTQFNTSEAVTIPERAPPKPNPKANQCGMMI